MQPTPSWTREDDSRGESSPRDSRDMVLRASAFECNMLSITEHGIISASRDDQRWPAQKDGRDPPSKLLSECSTLHISGFMKN